MPIKYTIALSTNKSHFKLSQTINITINYYSTQIVGKLLCAVNNIELENLGQSFTRHTSFCVRLWVSI